MDEAFSTTDSALPSSNTVSSLMVKMVALIIIVIIVSFKPFSLDNSYALVVGLP